MREYAEACLALCNDIDAVNDFLVCLMSAVYRLQSYYDGDASEFDSGPYQSVENWIFPKEDQVSNDDGGGPRFRRHQEQTRSQWMEHVRRSISKR